MMRMDIKTRVIIKRKYEFIELTFFVNPTK